MAIYALGDVEPTIDPTAYVHPDAVIIGDVRLGPGASVWPCAVLRGDESHIAIGADTSVQDGSVLHCTDRLPTVVGDRCVIGHIVHLEGCEVRDGALVGNGSVVLHEAVIGEGALVGSNAVVTAKMVVPPGAMALGIPAKIRETAEVPGWIIEATAQTYVHRATRYRNELRRLD
ncbi:MAG: gamma carbonic anhydrase family protein [Acidimicrobiia bacterium]|nr:gamma carbonic anhydrase family protein [Acidimicrobiia bacterium]